MTEDDSDKRPVIAITTFWMVSLKCFGQQEVTALREEARRYYDIVADSGLKDPALRHAKQRQ
jgi:hypothetical protein